VPGTAEHPDWSFAQRELLDKQGIDLRTEMEARYRSVHSHREHVGTLQLHGTPAVSQIP